MNKRMQREATAAEVGFLLADLDTALTFMETSKITHNPDTRLRNRKNAREAYDAVSEHLKKLEPDMAQQNLINRKLRTLRTSLRRAGEEV